MSSRHLSQLTCPKVNCCCSNLPYFSKWQCHTSGRSSQKPYSQTYSTLPCPIISTSASSVDHTRLSLPLSWAKPLYNLVWWLWGIPTNSLILLPSRGNASFSPLECGLDWSGNDFWDKVIHGTMAPCLLTVFLLVSDQSLWGKPTILNWGHTGTGEKAQR